MESFKMNRRDFNKSATLGIASLAMSAGPSVRNVLGANDRLRIGLIGSGGMGLVDLRDFLRTGQVDCLAVADPYEPNRDAGVMLTNGAAKPYLLFRRDENHEARRRNFSYLPEGSRRARRASAVY